MNKRLLVLFTMLFTLLPVHIYAAAPFVIGEGDSGDYPHWFWLLYYSLMLLTIASVFFSITKQRDIWRAILTIFVALSIPVVGLVNGIYREQNQNELEQWLSHLGTGELWALYLLFGYIYVIVWWGLLIRKRVSRHGKLPRQFRRE